VLASGHGDLLSRDDAVQALAPLLSLATVLTPNEPEAQALTGRGTAVAQMRRLREYAAARAADGRPWRGETCAICGTAEAISTARREWHRLRLAGSNFARQRTPPAAAIAGQLAMQAPLALALDAAQARTQRAGVFLCHRHRPAQLPARSTYYRDASQTIAWM
jgi:hydroxymethylpyrimidine/phosphomethylpyrimidine kinase